MYWETDPRTCQISLAELCETLGAPVAICSSPELQKSGRNAMKTVDQLTSKLKPKFQNKIVSVVDYWGSGARSSSLQKILSPDNPDDIKLLEDNFAPCEFNEYRTKYHANFEEQAKLESSDSDLDDKIRALAIQGFAIKNSESDAYWRGRVAGGLTMALSMTEPRELSTEDLKSIGIGDTLMDVNKLHAAVAAVIDGGPVSQQEQREIPDLIDEVVFDLRRRGYPWAANALVLLVRFPDIESFVNSLDGVKNLVRSARLKTRQVDQFIFGNKLGELPLAWDFTSEVPSEKAATTLNVKGGVAQVLSVTEDVTPMRLYHCARSGDAVGTKRLIDAKACVEGARYESGTTALASCALRNHVEVMEVLLKAVPHAMSYANQPNRSGITALYFASQEGCVEAARVLLKYGADANASRDTGTTPTWMAAQNGHSRVIEVLLQSQADINTANDNGTTALFMAAQSGHAEIVAQLLAKKADINKRKNTGMTPIYAAASAGRTEVLAVLFQNKADVDQAENSGVTPIFIAAQKGQYDVIEKLVKYRADVNKARNTGATPTFIAAQYGHDVVVEKLFLSRADVNHPTEDGATPMLIAAQKGHVDVVERLLWLRADINKAMDDGMTPTYAAASAGQAEVIELLVRHRADINRPENSGATPTFIANQFGHHDVVEKLLKHGADVNRAKPDGTASAWMAAQVGHSDVIETLVQNRADVNQASDDGATPTSIAAQKGHINVMEMLVQNHADINQAKKTGATPLFTAAQEGHVDMVEKLIEKGADLNLPANDGATPTFIAAQEGHYDVVQVLVEQGGMVNVPLHDGTTPTWIAAQNGHIDIVDLLLRSLLKQIRRTMKGLLPSSLQASLGTWKLWSYFYGAEQMSTKTGLMELLQCSSLASVGTLTLSRSS